MYMCVILGYFDNKITDAVFIYTASVVVGHSGMRWWAQPFAGMYL